MTLIHDPKPFCWHPHHGKGEAGADRISDSSRLFKSGAGMKKGSTVQGKKVKRLQMKIKLDLEEADVPADVNSDTPINSVREVMPLGRTMARLRYWRQSPARAVVRALVERSQIVASAGTRRTKLESCNPCKSTTLFKSPASPRTDAAIPPQLKTLSRLRSDTSSRPTVASRPKRPGLASPIS